MPRFRHFLVPSAGLGIGLGLWLFPISNSFAESYHEWSALHFDLAQTSSGLASPLRDVDGDGCENVIEYLADTDPWDANFRLEIDPSASPRTVEFAVNPNREDVTYEVVVSSDLFTWTQDATHLCAGSLPVWHVDHYEFVRVGVTRRIGFTIDSDQDGLDDYFEEAMVASNAGDAINHIGDVHANDDFDNDGTLNLDEEANAPQPMPGGSYAAPAFIDPAALNCSLDATSPKAPISLKVHTPLR